MLVEGLHSSVDKVTDTDTIDKKFASVTTVEKPNSTNFRSECWVMGENHTESRDLTARVWESDSAEAQITHVQGRLEKNLAFWKDVLQAPPPILDCIGNGYRLPLKFIPPPWAQLNQFVNEAVGSLLHNGSVARVQVLFPW